MERAIPGTVAIEGREYLYVEAESYHDFMDGVVADTDSPKPSSGGSLDELVRIRLPSGHSLIGLSYKGDLRGWRALMEAVCVAEDRLLGTIRSGCIHLASGDVYSLAECSITML
jgi:hypothetical protein